ncbi:MAG: putative protein tyrosine phosphatase [Candidatus Tokpelaia sp. JSC188]|nr:MAG: putative protein tyrosine phosphatase [Candidatus Tokpelaia sp. JSC188]
MSYLVISPLSQLAVTAKKHQVHNMVTLINIETNVIRPKTIPKSRHLCLYFNDINKKYKGLIAPAQEHIVALIQFAKSWNRISPLLVHCLMGISRSTAAAFIIACALNPAANEKQLAIRLREQAPSATPNLRLVSLADRLLTRKGQMNDAIRRIGRGCDTYEGSPFVFDFS